ncbi:MAG: molecular chaperone TorD family protein [Thermoleophilia bacterium]|nr:molecular chaperone TorD family protein [Thermoleophilia bacterium]
MAHETLGRAVTGAFADVLDYPRGPLAALVARCEAAASASPEAVALLAGFREFAESAGLGELQEAYTRAFDLDSMSDLEPTCYPYVGHVLFDDNHKRSAFLVGLNERYGEHGFSAGTELPDHLVVLLRFVASCEDAALAEELLDEAIMPALGRLVGKLDAEAVPETGRERYQLVLRALWLALGVRQRPARAGSEANELVLSRNGRD